MTETGTVKVTKVEQESTKSRLLKGIATVGLIIGAVLGGLHLHNTKLAEALQLADAVCDEVGDVEDALELNADGSSTR